MSARSPSREKDNRQPFPHTSSPHRQTTLPTASSSTTNLPASINPTPHTIESILALHGSASDPQLAALDQAVSERNVLSSQNSQLWKLIEKQRSGYNQIMKELERVRNERDAYKARLAAATGGPIVSEKRHLSRERVQKQSIDSVVTDGGMSSNNRDHNPRQNMTRFYSDEQGMFWQMNQVYSLVLIREQFHHEQTVTAYILLALTSLWRTLHRLPFLLPPWSLPLRLPTPAFTAPSK